MGIEPKNVAFAVGSCDAAPRWPRHIYFCRQRKLKIIFSAIHNINRVQRETTKPIITYNNQFKVITTSQVILSILQQVVSFQLGIWKSSR